MDLYAVIEQERRVTARLASVANVVVRVRASQPARQLRRLPFRPSP